MKLTAFILFYFLNSISSEGPSSRIIGGTDVVDGSAPYQCSLQRNERHGCGCAIIGDEWILTAAHCVRTGIQNVKILVGTNDLKSGGERYKTIDFIIHENYDKPPFSNDIALVKVENIQFNKKVQPIKYTSNYVEGGSVLLDSIRFDKDSNELPQFLQTINLTALSYEKCVEMIDDGVKVSNLCTFNGFDEGVCSGDSGTPLVLGDEVVGLGNWILNGCATGNPDVFVRISHFYDWIKEKTEAFENFEGGNL
ncbi:chymotrypsin-1-like isoform X2 [Contarinia nasturtii]|uniref:chymotrypsin-1-like isoform X2 n=1 Tax=Contarinia nasturtii TaxID=265458 RepID=UPI0012D41DDB|nr:chymotrypsin-1-like isoform X2 [Contarinia nasturtii]